MTDGPVLAIQKWATNAELIEDVARLGYLRKDWSTLDCTYGRGTFWNNWAPDNLEASDLLPVHPGVKAADFTKLQWSDRHFDCVVFDPPYKLNGTPDVEVDGRYGVDVKRTWQERMALCRDGLKECARVLGDGYLLMKMQDQVSSGKIRWQSYEFTKLAELLGLGLVDRLDFLSHRPQPEGRRQIHAHRCSSQLLVFKRGWVSSDV